MSPATADQLAKPHHAIVRLDVLEAGAVVASTTVPLDQLRMAEGAVEAVRRADVRRSASVRFADESGALVPLTGDDLLDPLERRELQLWRGLRYQDGTSELRSLAVVVIEQADVTEDAAITVEVKGRDRSVLVSGSPWTDPYTIASGTNVGTAIQAIIEDRAGAGAFEFAFSPVATTTTGRVTYDPSTNPWTAVQKMADGIGHEVFFDAEGVCVLRPVPDPNEAEVAWSFTGSTSLRVGAMRRTVDGANLVNGVIIDASAPWLTTPLRGEAWDTDPDSPTRVARIGERPLRITDATVFTQTAADAAAAAKLLDVLGVEEQVTFSAIVNPWLAEGDVIELYSRALGGTARGIVETLSIPVSVADAQQGTTRSRRAT